MEERDSFSLIYGFWVGFKSTSLSRPAHEVKTPYMSHLWAAYFVSQSLTARLHFLPHPPFLPLLPYQQLENCLVP